MCGNPCAPLIGTEVTFTFGKAPRTGVGDANASAVFVFYKLGTGVNA
jgi:hypothetical protein